MLKRVLSLFLIFLLAAVPVATAVTAPPTGQDVASLQAFEEYLKNNLFLREELKNIGSEVMLQSGQKEQDDVYYTADGLLKNYWPSGEEKIRRLNAQAIVAFAQNHDVPVSSVIIPTAAAVKQKLVPDNAPLYNQKEAIAQIGREMEGKVTVTDVYSSLYQCYDTNEEYLYYRTSSRLTSLGGYRIYEALGDRLHLSPLPLHSFSREYLVHGYYGELTDSWGKSRVGGDILAVYTNTSTQNDFRLQVTNLDGTVRSYNSPYPTDRMEEDPFSIYLGGECIGFELTAPGGKLDRSLLIFGDNNVQSVAPFLTGHYDRISYCNLEEIERDELGKLDVQEYDQVLFLYGIETFCDSQVIRKIDEIA